MAPAFFPQPYSDEILYSVIARYHQISGNLYNSDSMKDLFNYRLIVPSLALQTRLGNLSNNTKHLGIEFETLLFENTMFPYLMVFTLPENYKRVFQWAKSSDNRSDRFATGAIHKNIYPKEMMYCPECFKEETSLLGEGYWHRMHQTPGIVLCEKHKCCLLSSKIPTFNHLTANYEILNDGVTQEDNTAQHYKYCDNIINYGIYSDTKFLYDNFVRIRELFSDFNYSFRNAFFPELIKQQFATTAGTLKLNAFEDSFSTFYGDAYLKSIGLSISNSRNNKWLINLCREGSKHHTYALEYILLARFLFGSFENFINETEYNKNFSFSTSLKKSDKLVDSEFLELQRNRWLEIIRKELDKGCEAIYKANSALYKWLYIHDNEWLKEHLPVKLTRTHRPSNIVDWSERDRILAEQVSRKVLAIKNIDGKPQRITKKRICEALSYRTTLETNRDKLPLTFIALEKFIETTEQFRMRRCNWIIDELQKQGIYPTVAKVYSRLNIYGKADRSSWEKIIESILAEKGL